MQPKGFRLWTCAVVIVLSFLSVSSRSGAVQPLFDSPFLAYDVGGGGKSLSVEDFNGDGILDAACTHFSTKKLTCLLGNSDGTFQAPTILPLPSWANGQATCDFNRDGFLDVAVTIPESSLVVVCLGNGDGTFHAVAPPTQLGGWPDGIVAGNLDQDNIPDIALGTQQAAILTVMSGVGDGTFAPAVTYPCLNKTRFVALGDVNRDGWADIAVTNQSRVSIFLNMAGSGFGPRQDYGVGSNPSQPVLADLNADSWPDLLLGSSENGRAAAVFLNNGSGTIGPRMDYACPGSFTPTVIAADANRDGKPDIIAVSGYGDLSIRFGAGNGSFLGRSDYVTGSSASVVVCRDVDGDSWPEILAAGGGILAVSCNRGDGTYNKGLTTPTPDQPIDLVVGDVNGDTRMDCVLLAYSNVVAVLRGKGDGTFEPYSTFTISIAPTSIILDEINGDGKPDIVGVSTAGIVLVLLGNGDGTFAVGSSNPVGAGSFVVAAGRFNDDGMTDLVTLNDTSDSFSILLGHGDGTFSAQTAYPVTNPEGLAVGDLDNDGFTDMAVIRTSFPNAFATYLSHGTGQFPDGYVFGIPPGNCVALGDIDSNGILDAVIPGLDYILSGTGTGGFNYPSGFSFDGYAKELSLNDLDSDGHLDLLLPWSGSDAITVLVGYGDGSFGPQVNYGISKGPEGFCVADLNDDGNPDMVVPCRSKDFISVFLNKRPAISGVATSLAPGAPHLSTWPNPFYDSVHGKLELASQGRVTVDIYDVNGRRIRSVMDTLLEPGSHQVVWDGRNDRGIVVPAGLYWFRAETLDGTATRRIVLVR